MKKIDIEFEKGGRFTGVLLEEKAPKTCNEIWDRLPLEYRWHHSASAGQGLACEVDFTIERENQQILHTKGQVIFRVADPTRGIQSEIIIAYGLHATYSIRHFTHDPENVFAEIEEKLDELEKVGRRMFWEGGEKVTIRRKE
jgi:hypothetical protein